MRAFSVCRPATDAGRRRVWRRTCDLASRAHATLLLVHDRSSRDVCCAPRERLLCSSACPARARCMHPTARRGVHPSSRQRWVTSAAVRDEDHATPLAVTFSLAKRGPPSAAPLACHSEGAGILEWRRADARWPFLHYLWNEAELNRWQPSFAGRRSWATVRRRLLAASLGKTIGRRALSDLLYVPEVFSR
jgi:hypothetical protein